MQPVVTIQNLDDGGLSDIKPVSYNDEISPQLITMIEEHKSAVKAIVSFDRNIKIHNNDIDFYSFEHPKVELGRIAMKKLLRMLEGEEESSSVLPWG